MIENKKNLIEKNCQKNPTGFYNVSEPQNMPLHRALIVTPAQEHRIIILFNIVEI